ncbi:uncharacterized protein [Scyliorhinus torazame]|uniref:uncharacterized protein isoform X2 n=2 Tax=Scyliorhinus torazame TaxID=75743 RepID=UPI003B5BC1BE
MPYVWTNCTAAQENDPSSEGLRGSSIPVTSEMVKDSSGDQQEEIKMKVRNSGPGKGTAGADGKKIPNLVAYVLLGLFVLLMIIFVVGLLKFKQVSTEIEDFRDDVTMQIAKLKRELGDQIRNDHLQLVKGQRELGNKIVMLSTEVGNAHRDLHRGQSQITNDIARLTDQTHRSHSNFAIQLAEMKDNCQPQFECPDQWTLNRQRCYYFSPTLEDWSTSQRFCLSQMSNLAVIDNSEKQGFLKQEIKLTRHWIGLNESHNAGEWVWVDGTDYASTQTFWAAGEPRDFGNYEACAGMKSDGKWSVYSCSQKLNFICERPVFCHFK